MKKVISLLLVLVMCLSLCACNNTLSTEEALMRYPEIVGKWSDSFLGADSILVISEDGSCSVMDVSGTWTVDAKKSTDEYAVLHIETSSKNKYQVTLDIPRNYDVVRECHLSIVSAKKEEPIFDGYVTNQEQSIISHEQLLLNYPSLEGEWGSPYFAEDSVISLMSDGSCKILGKQGVWAGQKGLLNNGYIIARLENEKEYTIMYEFVDYGTDLIYDYLSASIFEHEYLNYYYKDIDLNKSDLLVNRSVVVNPTEAAPLIIGEWKESENSEPFAVFHEDGTCKLRGADGVWGLDYLAYYCEQFRNGWDLCYKAKTAEGEWDISISDYGNGIYGISILNPETGMHLISTLQAIKTSDTN